MILLLLLPYALVWFALGWLVARIVDNRRAINQLRREIDAFRRGDQLDP